MSGIKAFLERRLPGAYGALRMARYQHGLQRAFAHVVDREGLAVQHGPFRGLTYTPQVARRERLINHALLPKLLGCYEEELHPAVTALRLNRYSRIVNIGCAEGYYAIGLARLMPDVPVLAFDLDPVAQALCREMARVNGVADQVTIASECTADILRDLTSERALIICDCEGCERGVLSIDVLPSLRRCDLLVELHDCVDPSISRIIPERFIATHKVTLIHRSERDTSRYPAIQDLSPYRQRLAVSEFRWGAISWGSFRSESATA